MPAKSQAQQKFMGAELARKRAGKSTQTDMKASQLEDFASTRRKGLPKKVGSGGDYYGKGQGMPPLPPDPSLGGAPSPSPGVAGMPPAAGSAPEDKLARRRQLLMELQQIDAEIAQESQPTGESGLPLPQAPPVSPPPGGMMPGAMGAGPMPGGGGMPPGPMPPPMPGMGQAMPPDNLAPEPTLPMENAKRLAALAAPQAGASPMAQGTGEMPQPKKPTSKKPAAKKASAGKMGSKGPAKKSGAGRQRSLGRGQGVPDPGVGTYLARTTLGAPIADLPKAAKPAAAPKPAKQAAPDYTFLPSSWKEPAERSQNGYSLYGGEGIWDGWYDSDNRLVQQGNSRSTAPRAGTKPLVGFGQGELVPTQAARGGFLGQQPLGIGQAGGPAGGAMGKRAVKPMMSRR